MTYKEVAMRPLFLSIFFLFSVTCVHKPISGHSCAGGDHFVCQVEAELTRSLNRYRQGRGLSTVRHHSKAAAVAYRRSVQLLELGHITHHGFPNQHRELARSIGVAPLTFSAENLASFEFSDIQDPRAVAAQFMYLWIHSENHRKNLEGPFTYHGASVARKGRKWVATALFL